MQKTNEQLINNIIGQLNGIKKMMDANQACSDIIVQLKAAKSSFNTLSTRFISQSFMNCYQGVPKKEKEQMEKLLTELIKLT